MMVFKGTAGPYVIIPHGNVLCRGSLLPALPGEGGNGWEHLPKGAPHERRVIAGVGLHQPPRKSLLAQSGPTFASYLLRVPERPSPLRASVSPSRKWS